jgi:hypothetical protein
MAARLSAWGAGRPLPPRKIPGTYFNYRLSQLQGHSAAGNITSIGKSSYFIGIRTRDLPASRIVPRPNTLLLSWLPTHGLCGSRCFALRSQIFQSTVDHSHCLCAHIYKQLFEKNYKFKKENSLLKIVLNLRLLLRNPPIRIGFTQASLRNWTELNCTSNKSGLSPDRW